MYFTAINLIECSNKSLTYCLSRHDKQRQSKELRLAWIDGALGEEMAIHPYHRKLNDQIPIESNLHENEVELKLYCSE